MSIRTLSPASDPQVSAALARVHGRLRRRRQRVVGAGAASFAVALVVAIRLGTQGPAFETEARPGVRGADAIESGAAPAAAPPDESCGTVAARNWSEVELRIQGRREWPAEWTALGSARPVLVTVRNVGDDPLTVWSPAVVGATGSLVTTEQATPSLLPTTWTVDPSETIELPASLPDRSCTGDQLNAGQYEFVPILGVIRGDRSELVSGTPFTAVYR